MRIFQLMNVDGEPVGLYMTDREDIENIQEDFDAAFSDREVDDIQSNADDWLETHKGITRIFALEVTTDAI